MCINEKCVALNELNLVVPRLSLKVAGALFNLGTKRYSYRLESCGQQQEQIVDCSC